MRLVYFTDTEEIGGAERYLADLAAAAVDGGHEVWVLAPQTDLLDFVAETAPGARLAVAGTRAHHGPPTLGRASALGRALPGLTALLARLDPDLFHVNNGGYPGSDLCRMAPLAAKLAGTGPVLMTVHSMPWPRERDSVAAIQSAADVLVRRTVDGIICPAMAIADLLIDLRGFPRELISHVRYGAREPVGQGAEAQELRERLAPGGELLVGMVSARAIPEKGYDVFVEGLARAGDGIRAALVGPDPGQAIHDLAEQRDLGERLSFEGRVPAVNAYYHAADVLVMPSTAEECMPFVILESMAASKPVFSSRLAGAPEAIVDGETGRLFEPGDADRLGALLAEAAASDRGELSRMGTAGRARWESLFAPEAVATETLALYERVGRGGSGADPHAGEQVAAAPAVVDPVGDREAAVSALDERDRSG